MKKNRIPVLVYVDLDLVPGMFHTEESAVETIQSILENQIGHYNPEVVASPRPQLSVKSKVRITFDSIDDEADLDFGINVRRNNDEVSVVLVLNEDEVGWVIDEIRQILLGNGRVTIGNLFEFSTRSNGLASGDLKAWGWDDLSNLRVSTLSQSSHYAVTFPPASN